MPVLVQHIARPRLHGPVTMDRVVQVDAAEPITEDDPDTNPSMGCARLAVRAPSGRIRDRCCVPRNRKRPLVGIMTNPPRPCPHLDGNRRPTTAPKSTLTARSRAVPGRSTTPLRNRDHHPTITRPLHATILPGSVTKYHHNQQKRAHKRRRYWSAVNAATESARTRKRALTPF